MVYRSTSRHLQSECLLTISTNSQGYESVVSTAIWWKNPTPAILPADLPKIIDVAANLISFTKYAQFCLQGILSLIQIGCFSFQNARKTTDAVDSALYIINTRDYFHRIESAVSFEYTLRGVSRLHLPPVLGVFNLLTRKIRISVPPPLLSPLLHNRPFSLTKVLGSWARVGVAPPAFKALLRFLHGKKLSSDV